MPAPTLYPESLERSVPWLRKQAQVWAYRLGLIDFAEELESEFAERWLVNGRPPYVPWVAVDFQRKLWGRRHQWIPIELDESDLTTAERLDARVQAQRVLESLSAAERRVLEGYYFAGQTFAEIGREAGVSGSRVHQIRDGALESARGRWGAEA